MLWVKNVAAREGAYLRLPGSITRTQCTGTVPKTSGEGDLWLDMEGECGSSSRVELEQADDRESLEALHEGETSHVSEMFPSQRNVHKAVNVAHTRHKQRVERRRQGTLCGEVPTLGLFHSSITAHGIHLGNRIARACACAVHGYTSSTRADAWRTIL